MSATLHYRHPTFPHIWLDTMGADHCDRCGAHTNPPNPFTSTDLKGDFERLIETSREFRRRHRYCRRKDMRP